MTEPTIAYSEFKVLENNVRECYLRMQELAQAVKTVNETASVTLGIVQSLQLRVSQLERDLHGEAQRGPTANPDIAGTP